MPEGSKDESTSRNDRAQSELGRLLAAAEGYRVFASGKPIGWVDHVRYERHADHPDEIIVRSRGLLGARRRAVAFEAVEDVRPSERTVVVRTTRSASGKTLGAKRSCSVTQPNGNSPRVGQPPEKATSFNYGNGSLWIALWWPRRGVLAGIAPDGGVEATIEGDGSIHLKVGWYRGVKGKLRITGRRLDAMAGPLRAHVPDGYGPRGFQATGLIFPTVGCWQVRGTVGRASLTFVVRVAKR